MNKIQKRTLSISGEKSRIYFVTHQVYDCETTCNWWYEIDLKDVGCGRRLEKQPPSSFYFGVPAMGSCGSFLYSIGGMVGVEDPDIPVRRRAVTNTYFYNIAKPKEDWFEGPPMSSPRNGTSHQVIGSKIYVLGGARFRMDYYTKGCDSPLVWGEYLDVSLPPNEWTWRDVTLPPGGVFTDGGVLDNEGYISSLSLFKGRFDPVHHILCRSDSGISASRFLCYNVDNGSLCRVFERDMVRFHSGQNVFVDGDYMVLPDSTRVLAIGAFSSAETNNNNNKLSSPWFVGGISGDDHFPPMPLDANNFPFLTIDMDSWYCRDPCEFSLVRIAPYKYASLWSPDEGKHSVSLSVFKICPPTSPPPLDSLDLDILLRLDLLCIDDVPVRFEAERVHIPLWQEYGRKVDCFSIYAAVAV